MAGWDAPDKFSDVGDPDELDSVADSNEGTVLTGENHILQPVLPEDDWLVLDKDPDPDAERTDTKPLPPLPTFAVDVLTVLDERVTRIRKIHARKDTDKASVLEKRGLSSLFISFGF